MISISKPIDNLDATDLERYPVWQYANSDQLGETVVQPVKRVPVINLSNKVVGDYVHFANDADVLGLLGNFDVKNAKLTKHFLTLSIWNNGKWYCLPRYHDFDYSERGPAELAALLKLSVDEIFPISFDIRRFSKGNEAVLAGQILKDPLERLSRAEIIALAVP